MLGITVHLTSLECPPTLYWSLDLLWGLLRFYSGPTLCSCLQYPQLSELVRFLLWEHLMTFYIFHRHRVCLVDCVDLICSLYSWWEGLGSSSLVTLPLCFNFIEIETEVVLFPPLHVGRPYWRGMQAEGWSQGCLWVKVSPFCTRRVKSDRIDRRVKVMIG